MLVGVIVVALALSGCVPSASPPPTSPPTSTPGPGGYGDLDEACTGLADDLIMLRRIEGSVGLGVDRVGAEAILQELEERRSLAPPSLADAYRGVESAVEPLLSGADESPAPRSTEGASPVTPPSPTESAPLSPTGTASPVTPLSPTTTPTPDAQDAVSEAVDAAADTLEAWVRSNCDGS